MLRLLSVVVLAVCAAAWAPPEPARADERVVVRFADSTSGPDRAEARRAAGVEDPRGLAALDGVQVVQAPDGQAAEAAAALRDADGVLWAQPDRRVQAALALPTREMGSSAYLQWGLSFGDFMSAWDTTLGASVQIAVVDSGVDFAIADLGVNAAPAGYDWVGRDSDPAPAASSLSETSHGTHVAGIAAAALAVANRGSDITGGAPDATIMALRALDSKGSGWASDIAAAFAWAAEHGARVINASFSGVGASDVIAEAIATHRNTLFVVAAGNGGADGLGDDEDTRSADQRDYPCAYPAPNVVCIAAIDGDGARASFSNFGATSVDLGAPGVNILSYVRGGLLERWSGTSMATPYAAAAAALAFAEQPEASAAQVRVAMLASAWRLPALAGQTVAGGMVDAAALLRTLEAPEPGPALTAAVALPAGPPVVGRALTPGGGTFDRGSVTWSWERCDTSGSACAPLLDAWSAAYTPTAGDAGTRLRVTATATSTGGSTASVSELSEPVVAPRAVSAAPAPAPAATATPAPAAPAIPTIDAPLSARWSVAGSRLSLQRLVVSRLPHGAVVKVGCRGTGCPLRSLTATTASHGAIDLRRALGRRTTFRAGETLEVVVTAPGHHGEALRFVLKRGKRPVAVRLCVPAGTSQRRTSC